MEHNLWRPSDHWNFEMTAQFVENWCYPE